MQSLIKVCLQRARPKPDGAELPSELCHRGSLLRLSQPLNCSVRSRFVGRKSHPRGLAANSHILAVLASRAGLENLATMLARMGTRPTRAAANLDSLLRSCEQQPQPRG